MKRSWMRIVCLSGIVLVSGGCGALRSPSTEMGVVAGKEPATWAASREARSGIDHQWVERFQDSELARLVDQGLTENASVREAAERVEQAIQTARVDRSEGLPQLSGSLSGVRDKRNFIGFPFGGGGAASSTIVNTFGASLDVSWELDLWGRIRNATEAELARVEAQEQALRATRASLAGQITKAWFALGEANEQLALAYESLDIRRKTERAIEERFRQSLESEGGTAAQYRLAKTDTANARGDIERWKGEVERAARQIQQLVARYPDGKLFKKGSALPRLPKHPPVGLPSELLQRRPDILEAERLYAAAIRDAKAAYLARFPTLALTSSGGRSSEELGDLLNSDFGVWSLAGNLAAPILSGGSLKANEKRAQSVQREALAKLEKTVLAAFGEVEQALVADAVLAKRLAAAKEALAEAEAADAASARDYADGVDTILTVLQARGQRISIASQLVTLRRLQLENRVDLHLALGGDYSVRAK